MNYRLNKKAFAGLRIVSKDPNHKYGYMYVSPKGVVTTDSYRLVRITLPETLQAQPTIPAIFPLADVEPLRPAQADVPVQLPVGLPAKSTGQYSVPVFDNAIPGPEQMQASIILDAKLLIDLLKAGCDVTDHSRNLCRLSIGKNGQVLRLDMHHEEGQQEFTGMQMSVRYEGTCINGKTSGTPAPQTEVVDPKTIALPLNEGRKFRE